MQVHRFPLPVGKYSFRPAWRQTIGSIGDTDRIDVHLELGREPEVETVGHKDVLVTTTELVGETPEPAHFAPLFFRKEESIVLALLDLSQGAEHVLIDALDAIAVQVENLHLFMRIP